MSEKSTEFEFNESDKSVSAKFLIPAISAGAVIGKEGSSIGSLQKSTGTKVRLSKQNEFYPGTLERVCLIAGTIKGVVEITKYIYEQIGEKGSFPQFSSNSEGGNSNINPYYGDRSKQIKMVVPNVTAGMIIGKGGAYIKQLQEATGVTVQLSKRSSNEPGVHPALINERILTIFGPFELSRMVLVQVLEKLIEDPMAGSALYTSISYSSGDSMGSGNYGNYGMQSSHFHSHHSSGPNSKYRRVHPGHMTYNGNVSGSGASYSSSADHYSSSHVNSSAYDHSHHSSILSPSASYHSSFQDKHSSGTTFEKEFQVPESILHYLLENLYSILKDFDVNLTILSKRASNLTSANSSGSMQSVRKNGSSVDISSPGSIKWRIVRLAGDNASVMQAHSCVMELVKLALSYDYSQSGPAASALCSEAGLN